MCVALGKNGAIGINGFKNVDGKWGFYAADDTDKVGGVLYSVYEKTQTASIALMRQLTPTSFDRRRTDNLHRRQIYEI